MVNDNKQHWKNTTLPSFIKGIMIRFVFVFMTSQMERHYQRCSFTKIVSVCGALYSFGNKSDPNHLCRILFCIPTPRVSPSTQSGYNPDKTFRTISYLKRDGNVDVLLQWKGKGQPELRPKQVKYYLNNLLHWNLNLRHLRHRNRYNQLHSMISLMVHVQRCNPIQKKQELKLGQQ